MDTIKIDYNALRKDYWSDQESQNAKLIIDFVQHLMNDHDFEYVTQKFSHQNYVQHNRNIPDGLEALIGYVKNFSKQFPEYAYDVKHIYTDGDHVIFHSHATVKRKHRGNDKKGFNIIDKWRVKNGEIMEHWDAIQPLDAFMRFYIWMVGGKIRNTNGVY